MTSWVLVTEVSSKSSRVCIFFSRTYVQQAQAQAVHTVQVIDFHMNDLDLPGKIYS